MTRADLLRYCELLLGEPVWITQTREGQGPGRPVRVSVHYPRLGDLYARGNGFLEAAVAVAERRTRVIVGIDRGTVER